MCRLRTYLSLSAVKTSQNLPNDGATPTLRNGRVQLLSGHLDCFNRPRPVVTSHKRPRKQRKARLWSCLRAVRLDSPVLEGRPTVLHNIDHSNIFGTHIKPTRNKGNHTNRQFWFWQLRIGTLDTISESDTVFATFGNQEIMISVIFTQPWGQICVFSFYHSIYGHCWLS